MTFEEIIDDLDLNIRITDEWHNYYVVNDIFWDYELIFRFENWTRIFNNERKNIQICAEYRSNKNGVLCKWQDETLEGLYKKVKEWNLNHRYKTINYENIC